MHNRAVSGFSTIEPSQRPGRTPARAVPDYHFNGNRELIRLQEPRASPPRICRKGIAVGLTLGERLTC